MVTGQLNAITILTPGHFSDQLSFRGENLSCVGDMENLTKQCSKCKEVKGLAQFTQNIRYAYGVLAWCKACRSEYNYAYRNTTRGKVIFKKSAARYQSSERGRATAIKGARRARKLYPMKAKARSMISVAVRDGKLPSAKTCECVYCGEQAAFWHHWRDTKKSIGWMLFRYVVNVTRKHIHPPGQYFEGIG